MKPVATVVTGASAGIGAAIAKHLLDRGHTVVALQRSAPKLLHERLHHVAADLVDPVATQAAAGEILSRFDVRYLVNNAGANRPGWFDQQTLADLDYAYALNVRAAFVLTKAFVPGMRAAKFGRILSISSRAVLGKTERTVYAATKAGLIGMTHVLCLELAPHGITVNVIAPGPVASELFTRGHPEGSEKRQKVIDSIPVGRIGTPEDVARAAGFLLADENSYVTGQTLFVCGGTSVSGSGGA
jgi:NAD(P)-dependent dehydrogenase (short-subunit alcohol dehydrogenase family)